MSTRDRLGGSISKKKKKDGVVSQKKKPRLSPMASNNPRQKQQKRQQQPQPQQPHSQRTKKLCDMCVLPDGANGFHLLNCTQCGLDVHAECYGYFPSSLMNDDDDDSDKEDGSNTTKTFVCWACRAVGTTIKFRERYQIDDKRDKQQRRVSHNKHDPRWEDTIRQRPTECCLCSVDDGLDVPHAMHPLFDDYGPRARQILLPATLTRHGLGAFYQKSGQQLPNNRPFRPAFAHTICAMGLGSKGFCFGCTSDGAFLGDDDEDDRLFHDDDSLNSQLVRRHDNTESYDPELDYDPTETVCHFAWTCEQWYGPDHLSIKNQKNFQELQCFLCGSRDKSSKTLTKHACYRVPLQCNANDADEWKAARGSHVQLGQMTCFQAVHVGCAHYARLSKHRRFLFFPGNDEKDPAMSVYCDLHAKDLVQANVASSRDARFMLPESSADSSKSGKGPPSYQRVSTIVARSNAQKMAHIEQNEYQATSNARLASGPSSVPSRKRPPDSDSLGPVPKRKRSSSTDMTASAKKPNRTAIVSTIGQSNPAQTKTAPTDKNQMSSASLPSNNTKPPAVSRKTPVPNHKPSALTLGNPDKTGTKYTGATVAQKGASQSLALEPLDEILFLNIITDLRKQDITSATAENAQHIARIKKRWKKQALHLSSGTFASIWDRAWKSATQSLEKPQTLSGGEALLNQPVSQKEQIRNASVPLGSAGTINSNGETESTTENATKERRSSISESKQSESSTARETLYHDALERIAAMVTDQRHEPLANILETQEHVCSQQMSEHMGPAFSRAQFDKLWKRVVVQATLDWEHHLASQEMDWTFLTTGQDYDYQKANVYCSNYDTSTFEKGQGEEMR